MISVFRAHRGMDFYEIICRVLSDKIKYLFDFYYYYLNEFWCISAFRSFFYPFFMKTNARLVDGGHFIAVPIELPPGLRPAQSAAPIGTFLQKSYSPQLPSLFNFCKHVTWIYHRKPGCRHHGTVNMSWKKSRILVAKGHDDPISVWYRHQAFLLMDSTWF